VEYTKNTEKTEKTENMYKNSTKKSPKVWAFDIFMVENVGTISIILHNLISHKNGK